MSALFGGPLDGSAAVRFIYTDEAGTSANEPATVVVGLVVHADKQLLPAIEAVEQVLTLIPEKYREGFVFHATAIWNSPRYRPDWSMEDRKAFLMAMMAVPRACGIAISYGIFYRDGQIDPKTNLDGMTAVQYQHAHAFGSCMACADEYISKFAAPEEVATIVAEDIPEMRKRLEQTVRHLRMGIMRIQNALVTYDVAGKSTQQKQPVNLRVRKVIHNIHFTPKDSAHLLWATDAVAFGLRRYYSNQSQGLDFGRAVIGPDIGPPARNLDCACGYLCCETPDAVPFQ
jgi:hypothetical protein